MNGFRFTLKVIYGPNKTTSECLGHSNYTYIIPDPFFIRRSLPHRELFASGSSKCSSLEILLRAIFVFGGISTISFFTFWGLQRRKRYGKWLGVISLALLLGLQLSGEQSRVLYAYIFSGGNVRRAMPAGYHDYSNDTQLNTAATFIALLHLSLLFLIFRLAFARASKRFFKSGELLDSQKEPDKALDQTSQKSSMGEIRESRSDD